MTKWPLTPHPLPITPDPYDSWGWQLFVFIVLRKLSCLFCYYIRMFSRHITAKSVNGVVVTWNPSKVQLGVRFPLNAWFLQFYIIFWFRKFVLPLKITEILYVITYFLLRITTFWGCLLMVWCQNLNLYLYIFMYGVIYSDHIWFCYPCWWELIIIDFVSGSNLLL